MNQPILVHSWVSDEVLADLKSRFEVDHVDVLASGALPPEEFARRARGKAGLMISAAKVPANLLSACAGTLKVVANVAVGYDNVDIDAATAAGVQVTNTPDVLTDAVAEMTIGLVIAVARHLIEADRYTRAGKFKANSFGLFWGAPLVGETLGIIGLGRIGKAVARRLRGFGMKVIYNDILDFDAALERELEVERRSLEALLGEARYVLLHVPLTPLTHHMINAERLALMREDAYLVNIARGPVVHEEALIEALETGDIGGAALDVYEFEPKFAPRLAELDNVVLTPHIGSATVQTRHAMLQTAAANLKACLPGEPVPNPVNRLA
jgi:lactate dehydrogenase-like 2-hydroxyacid dehydrogenase